MPSRAIALVLMVGVCGGAAYAQGRGAAGNAPVQQAPTDRTVPISKEQLAQYLKEMDARKIATLRLIEGGKFNANIRRITAPERPLIHPNTIDFWVVIEGSGAVTTGGRVENDRIVGGETHPVKVGDIEFIPANLPHAMSQINGSSIT